MGGRGSLSGGQVVLDGSVPLLVAFIVLTKLRLRVGLTIKRNASFFGLVRERGLRRLGALALVHLSFPGRGRRERCFVSNKTTFFYETSKHINFQFFYFVC